MTQTLEDRRRYNRDWARAHHVPTGRSVLDRLWMRVFRTAWCWVWLGPLMLGGRYGGISVQGKTKPAHKVAWESVNGPVPEGLELDHLCRNRRCVRPDHLEPVTHLENMRRGARAQEVPLRGYRCRFHADERMVEAAGTWVCRICRRAANVRYRRRLGGTDRDVASRRMWARRTPEQRAEVSRKIWETRRRNAAA